MKQNPYIGFFGSPLLAAECLCSLLKTYTVSLVITQPDRRSGRGMKTGITPVKECALLHGIDLYQPQALDITLLQKLEAHRVDLIVVVAYGRLLPKTVIFKPAFGSLNLHASLLPKYRGPSPIEAAILDGDESSGFTLQILSEKMDAGDIIAQHPIPLTLEMNASDLMDEIIRTAPDFLVDAIGGYLDGSLKPYSQDESKATYCAPVRKEDGSIDWRQDATAIVNKIRSFDMWPVAYTFLNGKRLRIFRARAVQRNRDGTRPGCIVDLDRHEGVLVQTGNGIIGIRELQPENKKRMDFSEFINGYRGLKGTVLESRIN
jgi:methionyl-tRNA formyltransferase